MWNMPHMLGGMQFAFGGVILFFGLFLGGIAILAINIVLLIKVIRMEKILKKRENESLQS